MSLRVLLADESDTIKKVFQLALQDFNAEVKAVHSGLDVVDVAQSFEPHILFADVLLQKVNGYKISQDIKKDEKLSSTPTVLMWSSFLELDQEQYKGSGAIDHLEKPFDADQLREIIKSHVPHVKDQKIGDFLTYPSSIREETPAAPPAEEGSYEESGSAFNLGTVSVEMAEIEKMPDAAPIEPQLPTEPIPAAGQLPDYPVVADSSAVETLSLTLEEEPPTAIKPLPDIEETMAPINLGPAVSEPVVNEAITHDEDAENWNHQDLSQFQLEENTDAHNLDLEKFESLNLGENAPEPEAFHPTHGSAATEPAEVAATEESVAVTSIDQVFEQTSTNSSEPWAPQNTDSATAAATLEGITPEMEAIVRAHTEEYLKTFVEKSLLQSIERIVKNELNRLLDEETRLNEELDDSL